MLRPGPGGAPRNAAEAGWAWGGRTPRPSPPPSPTERRVAGHERPEGTVGQEGPPGQLRELERRGRAAVQQRRVHRHRRLPGGQPQESQRAVHVEHGFHAAVLDQEWGPQQAQDGADLVAWWPRGRQQGTGEDRMVAGWLGAGCLGGVGGGALWCAAPRRVVSTTSCRGMPAMHALTLTSADACADVPCMHSQGCVPMPGARAVHAPCIIRYGRCIPHVSRRSMASHCLGQPNRPT